MHRVHTGCVLFHVLITQSWEMWPGISDKLSNEMRNLKCLSDHRVYASVHPLMLHVVAFL